MPGGRYEGTGGPGLEGPAVLKADPYQDMGRGDRPGSPVRRMREGGGGLGNMQFGGPGLETPAVLKAAPQPSIGDMQFRGPVRQDPRENYVPPTIDNPVTDLSAMMGPPVRPMQQTPQQQFQPPPQMSCPELSRTRSR